MTDQQIIDKLRSIRALDCREYATEVLETIEQAVTALEAHQWRDIDSAPSGSLNLCLLACQIEGRTVIGIGPPNKDLKNIFAFKPLDKPEEWYEKRRRVLLDS